MVRASLITHTPLGWFEGLRQRELLQWCEVITEEMAAREEESSGYSEGT